MFPEQQKIELFARRKFKGWTTWGLDMVLDSYKAFPEVQKLTDSKSKEQYLELEIE
jgi:N6-adenosine-specific RNA methylase IME4